MYQPKSKYFRNSKVMNRTPKWSSSIGKIHQWFHEASSEEVIIGWWVQTSNDDALTWFETIIEDKAGQWLC